MSERRNGYRSPFGYPSIKLRRERCDGYRGYAAVLFNTAGIAESVKDPAPSLMLHVFRTFFPVALNFDSLFHFAG